MTTLAAFLNAIAVLTANLKSIAIAYRMLVMSVLGLVLSIASVWAFFYHPQAFIVVTAAAILGCVMGPPLIAWARGEQGS